MFTQIITRGRFCAPLTAVVLFLALFAPAHAQSTTTLQGRVVDPKGAAVPGVKVTARSQATGVERVAQSDSGGSFQIASLPAGLYRLEVRWPQRGHRAALRQRGFFDYQKYEDRRASAQFRAEFFDLFNHANLGQPGNIIGTPAFGRISTTRFPTGESGSSRQVQFAMKLMF